MVLRLLFIGDVVGRQGRRCLTYLLPEIRASYGIDSVIANGENAAGGIGITGEVAEELFVNGVDIITSGNHIWDKKEVFDFIDQEERLLRPANYPPKTTPGRGSCIYQVGGSIIGVLNLLGRVFMPDVDCPFRKAEEEINLIREQAQVIIVDFHAEATSEKIAMGWFLDGKVTAVIGTHTHVQTADARVLKKGTGYITDVGMTGPLDSVIGVKAGDVINKFITGLPGRFNVEESGASQLNGVVITVDSTEGRCLEIERMYRCDV